MASPIAPLTGCLELCMSIVEHLNAARHNKKECSSLCIIIKGIQGFLKKLPPDGLSTEGNQILVDVATLLNHSQHFLIKVSNTGPLVTLLRAKDFREDLLRFNRDLSNLFNIMSSGEKLVYLHEARKQAVQTVQAELRTSKTLFSDQEMRADELLSSSESSAAAHASREAECFADESLEQVEEIAHLSPEELLADIYALQMESMYHGGRPKPLGSKTEEFLVQQVCAAFAPKASQADKPLSPPAAAQPLAQYLCPISREIMVQPVILVETGQTYDSDTIKRWLDEHDTCPVTGRRVSSKQVVANHALQKIIGEWAQEHGLRLASSSTNKNELAVVPDDVDPGGSSSSRVQARTMQGLLPGHANEAAASPRLGNRLKFPGCACRCTRTSWAVSLILLVVGVGMGLGMAIYFATKHKSGEASTSPSSPSPSPQTVVPVNSPKSNPALQPLPGQSWPSSQQLATATVAVAAGGGTICGIISGSRQLRCWGGNRLTPTVPGQLANASWAKVSIDKENGACICGILANSSALQCWGSDPKDGQCSSIPRDVATAACADVAVGGYSQTCAIFKDSNKMRCWDWTPTNNDILPISDVTLRWISVTVGTGFVCGILADSDLLRCWPQYEYGATTPWASPDYLAAATPPVDLASSAWTVVVATGYSACGIQASSGEVTCWGHNNFDQNRPQNVSGWVAVAVGVYHVCGITKDSARRLMCWGDNTWNQTAVPSDFVNSSWQDVAAGAYFTCGILSGSGALKCWGYNYSGQLVVPTYP